MITEQLATGKEHSPMARELSPLRQTSLRRHISEVDQQFFQDPRERLRALHW